MINALVNHQCFPSSLSLGTTGICSSGGPLCFEVIFVLIIVFA